MRGHTSWRWRSTGAGVVGLACGAGLLMASTDRGPMPTVDTPTCDTSGVPSIARLARQARPGVVSIVATGPSEPPAPGTQPRELFERYYGTQDPPTRGLASGFVIRADGYVLTNAHVVENAAALSVALGDDPGHHYPAAVVGMDPPSDLAVIKVDAGRPLTPLPLGDSDQLQVGDWLTVIGNPFGLDQSVSVGIVSFLGRHDVRPGGRPGYYDFIQTDAAINPGNSGGPVLDRQGRVVAVSAAVNSSGSGIAFAIPVNMAKDLLPDLLSRGTVRRSYLGVSIQDLTTPLAQSFGVARGVAVTEVSDDGPAHAAGIRPGDVITTIDGLPVDSAFRLRWIVAQGGIGHRARLTVVRGAAARPVEVLLTALPGDEQPAIPSVPNSGRGRLGKAGFSLSDKQSGLDGQGLRVLDVDATSDAYAAGLRVGDVVVQVDSEPVSSSEQVSAWIAASRGPLRLFVRRGLRPLFIGIVPMQPSDAAPASDVAPASPR